MADVAVESLLGKLHELLIYQSSLISEAKYQFEMLENDLRLIKAFLKDCSKQQRKDDMSLRELVRQIREVVYEAEDMIDSFVAQDAESNFKNYCLRCIQLTPKKPGISQQLEFVRDKLKDIYANRSRIKFPILDTAGDKRRDENEAPLVRRDNLVGFDDEAEKLIGYLTEETPQLDVVSIIGMPGLGKTTLAGTIFRDPRIQYEFPICIWVHIAQEFWQKDAFLAILRSFTRVTEDMYERTDAELARIVANNLEGTKFLIVIDDVRSVDDWDKIQFALPKNNNKGKVLITSFNEEVGWYANKSRPPHKLRFLNQDESWELLKWEVFNKPECPSELENIGKLIAEQCDGLPLAIVVIGRILARDFSSIDVKARKSAWREAYQRLNAYLYQRFYEDLPSQLRDCFLYLGMFPEDYEIPVWQLIHLWIAEGFIPEKEACDLEETAEKYLEDLFNRNLLRIDKVKSDGKVKTCRVHHTLREFCKTEAGHEKENLLHEINRSSDGHFEPPPSDMQKFRRLCIHSNVLAFLSSKPYCPGVRSFVCFSRDDIHLPPENGSAIPAAFNLLRVLDIKPIKFTEIPSNLCQLMHLRYIALSFNLSILPAAFSKLWNIQILIVDTTSRTLEIKADIWKLMRLRCLKTNASATLPNPTKTSESEREKLHTLGTISPESCTDQVFGRARNLKKLGIRGRLSLLLDGKIGSFDNLGKLRNLEKLKLLNDAFPSPASEGELRGLPPAYKFPPTLKKLTLSDTLLDWDCMTILGSLESLKILKLKDNAFMGPSWVVADGSFRKLEVLHIGRTDLVYWEASGHHFRRLRRLLLWNCEKLREVPMGLADVPTLQLLDLYYTKRAAASARKIYELIHFNLKQKYIKATAFKLSIYPDE